MARNATLGGKAPQSGNNVSHSHRKTRHQWMPNMQARSLYSMSLNRFIRLTLPACVLRSVDQSGGLDNYLLNISPEQQMQLERPIRQFRKLIAERTGQSSVMA